MPYLMLDIETLSTRPDAAVVAIGCAVFDLDGVISSSGWRIRPTDWIGHIDPATLKWWMDQSNEARTATFGGTTSAGSVATQLREWLSSNISGVYANDPSFDIAILKNWWTNFSGTPFPFSYKLERSYRTITALAKRYGIDYSSAYDRAIPHDAVSDACCQARAVALIQAELDRRMRL